MNINLIITGTHKTKTHLTMKKLRIFAIAALATVGLSSCLKEKITPDGPISEGEYNLTIRLADNSTRSVEDPASLTAGTDIVLSNGVIFVFNAAGDLIIKNTLEPVAALSAAGQTLTTAIKDEASGTETVFVIGNMGNLSSPAFASGDFLTVAEAASTAGTAAKVSDIMALAENLSTLTGASFGSAVNFIKNVPLATVAAGTKTFGAQPITFNSAAKTASVSTPLSPIVSRIEFTQVGDYKDDDASPMVYTKGVQQGTAAGGKAYSLTGVFLTGYAPQYTWGGSYAGTIVNQTSASYMKTTGSGLMSAAEYTATGNIGEVISPLVADGTGKAKNGSSKVFAYNIPAGLAPKIMIRVQNGSATDFNESGYSSSLQSVNAMSSTDADKLADTNNNGSVSPTEPVIKTISVKQYTGITSFEPGKIYKVTEIPFDSNSFYELAGDYSLAVNVTIEDWDTVTLTPEM